MTFLSDESARRIEAGLADKTVDRATFTRWVHELLADRRARTTIQRLSRRAHFMGYRRPSRLRTQTNIPDTRDLPF